MMVRLHVLAEGQTEETFVNLVLRPHLAHQSVYVSVRCICPKKIRRRQAAGGIVPYDSFKRDLDRWIAEDSNEDSWFTTMIDLYALPDSFPGHGPRVGQIDPFERVNAIEAAMADDQEYRRFVPYVQLHEFEALIFTDPQQLDQEFLEHEAQIAELVEISQMFQSPEHIDDDPATAPSKQIIKRIPEYVGRKASAGPSVAKQIGINKLRANCQHFGIWLDRLETLGKEG
ncbi:MAG: DUF4276 family protein [Alphaproteobacteria bacterium]|nr:DUF4276 family protein [Alphaproteobacteria bacterium]